MKSSGSFPQMLCRCLILHLLIQGVIPCLMLAPPRELAGQVRQSGSEGGVSKKLFYKKENVRN